MALMMATWSLHSIDEAVFDSFVATPTDDQLELMVAKSNANDSEATEWTADSVLQNLTRNVWYEGLDVWQMRGWDNAIESLLERSEFDMRAHGYHCSVSDMFIELATLAYADRGVDAIVRRFWPYRFFDICVRTRVGRDPQMDRFDDYFPTHALLTNAQVGQLLEEVAQYPALLDEFAKGNPSFVARWRSEIETELTEEAVPALTEIFNGQRMWYAMLDY